jgi:hypothetical protein
MYRQVVTRFHTGWAKSRYTLCYILYTAYLILAHVVFILLYSTSNFRKEKPCKASGMSKFAVRWEVEPRLCLPVPVHGNAAFYHRPPTCTVADAKSQPSLGIYQKQPASLASLSKSWILGQDKANIP